MKKQLRLSKEQEENLKKVLTNNEYINSLNYFNLYASELKQTHLKKRTLIQKLLAWFKGEK